VQTVTTSKSKAKAASHFERIMTEAGERQRGRQAASALPLSNSSTLSQASVMVDSAILQKRPSFDPDAV
jgi:hypothetical protein